MSIRSHPLLLKELKLNIYSKLLRTSPETSHRMMGKKCSQKHNKEQETDELCSHLLFYGWKTHLHIWRTIHHQHKAPQELILLPGSAWRGWSCRWAPTRERKAAKKEWQEQPGCQNQIPPVKRPPLWNSHTELLPKTKKNPKKLQLNKMPERMWAADPWGPFQLN